EIIARMVQNHTAELRLYADGPDANPAPPCVGFGLDYAVHTDPAASGSPYGQGTYYWGGAAGTWFWIDPANDLFFIGMIQSMGGDPKQGGMNFRGDSVKLVYDALGVPAPAAAAPADAAAQ